MNLFKNWKRKNQWILITLIVLIIGIGGVLAFYTYKIDHALNTMYQPVNREVSNIKKEEIPKATGAKTYLILGTDQRPGDKGRTDGIIIAIVNDFTHKITLTSIPRDTYVEIAGTKTKTKINAAYPFKGISGSIATVENFSGIPIDHYIWFNMEGFQKAIDAIGGVKVNVDSSVAQHINRQFSVSLPGKGEQLLTGEQALFFSRFRYDINGDFGRNDRQQEVLKAFLDQSKDIRSPLKINNLLDILGQDVRMDINKSELYSLAKQLNDYSSMNVQQVKYKATTGPINGVSYVFISDAERERVASILKERINEK